jgi:hypothetical protein
MAQLLKCQVCGFTISEKQMKGDVCPACGVPREKLELFEPKISDKRRKILDLHLHPIILHFPQALSFLIFFFAALNLLFPTFLTDVILTSLPLLSFLLPFFVVLAMLSGMYDGKMRFKSITTPWLKLKIIIGAIFLLCSVLVAVFAFLIIALDLALLLVVIFSLGCIITGGINGFIGGNLICAKMPGS